MSAVRGPVKEESELLEVEEQALERIEDVSPLPELAATTAEEEEEERLPLFRYCVAVGFALLAAAVMVGGVFIGIVTPRLTAAIAGALGVLLGLAAFRIRQAALLYASVVIGVFAIGVIMVVPSGLDNVFGLTGLVRGAATSGDVLRPPVEFTPGWRAILGWLMGALGFVGTWTALELRRASIGLLLPLPLVAIGAISVPSEGQIPSGIVALVLFAVALGVLSGAQVGGDDQERPTLGYELRRAAKALPLMAGITVALVLLAQTDFLFPKPIFDPTQEARKPQTIPLSEVPDRVLFRVKSSISGPWRMGSLDVYQSDDSTWRLPPFAQSLLREVPRSGVVDSQLTPGIKATFTMGDLGGAILPGLPNAVGIVAAGPKLAYDHRTGNIRAAQGALEPGLEYTVVAAIIPPVSTLQTVKQGIPSDIQPFLDIPEPPPGVEALLDRAPNTSPWDRLDFMRMELLKTVVSEGSGVPAPVAPSKVDDMLTGSKKGTPFEIVAAQAMLARWSGVPSRIGYGFDGGEKVGDFLEVRPKHGASFLEVYFPTFKWLPVIGTPIQASTSISNDPQQFNPNVVASDEVAVKVVLPVALNPRNYLFAQVQRVLLVVVPVVLFVLILYYGWPIIRKAYFRSRRRSWAAKQGAHARIAVAYAEWREVATDFGYRFQSETPLMFLDRVVEDDEHAEFAWLVTRCLWGDLRNNVGESDAAAAEELSRALQKRLRQGHSGTLRLIASISRLSLREPFAPGLRPHVEPRRRPKAPALRPAATVFMALCLVLLTACSGLLTPRVGLRQKAADLVFGIPPLEEPAAPPNVLVGEQDIQVVGGARALQRQPREIPRPPVSVPCPAAEFNTVDKESTFVVEETQRAGKYRWKVEGDYQIIGIGRVKFQPFEEREVVDVKPDSDNDANFTFTIVQTELGTNNIKKTQFHVVNESLTTPLGIYLTRITPIRQTDRGLQEQRPFVPQPPVLYLPLPVTLGTSFTSSGVDPTTLQTLQNQAFVRSRERYDACGKMVDGIFVDATQTFASSESGSVTYDYDYAFATQFGAMLVFEHLETPCVQYDQTQRRCVPEGNRRFNTNIGQLEPRTE